MATLAINFDQHEPQRFGNLSLITGRVSFTSATAGVDFREIEMVFDKLYTVKFENSFGYTAEYQRVASTGIDAKTIICYPPNSATRDTGTALEFYFTAIGQGG